MQIKNLITKITIVLLSAVTIWALVAAVDRTMCEKSGSIIIKIQGEEDYQAMISEDDLRVILDREFNDIMVGQKMAEVDIARVEERLTSEPYLAKVHVYIDAKKKMHVEVTPRVAHMRIMHNDGRSYFIDEGGYMFPVSRHFTPRVHVVTGMVPVYTKPIFEEEETSLLKDVHELVKHIQEDEFLNAFVEEIHITQSKSIELIPKVGKHRVVYGHHRSEEMADRFENLKIFYQEGLPYEGWNKYSSINIEFKDQVVCSVK